MIVVRLLAGNNQEEISDMDTQELHDRGLKLRIDMFGREAVDKRVSAFGDFGKPLQTSSTLTHTGTFGAGRHSPQQQNLSS